MTCPKSPNRLELRSPGSQLRLQLQRFRNPSDPPTCAGLCLTAYCPQLIDSGVQRLTHILKYPYRWSCTISLGKQFHRLMQLTRKVSSILSIHFFFLYFIQCSSFTTQGARSSVGINLPCSINDKGIIPFTPVEDLAQTDRGPWKDVQSGKGACLVHPLEETITLPALREAQAMFIPCSLCVPQNGCHFYWFEY